MYIWKINFQIFNCCKLWQLFFDYIENLEVNSVYDLNNSTSFSDSFPPLPVSTYITRTPCQNWINWNTTPLSNIVLPITKGMQTVTKPHPQALPPWDPEVGRTYGLGTLFFHNDWDGFVRLSKAKQPLPELDTLLNQTSEASKQTSKTGHGKGYMSIYISTIQ